MSKSNCKLISIALVYLVIEIYIMMKAYDKQLFFAFFGFIAFSFFLYNSFGITRTGEGTTGKGYGLYFEIIDRIRNPEADKRSALTLLDPINILFLLLAIVNFILSSLS